ncbi:MAG TPA: VOC family protein [Ktedonobacterales bacterium]|nr:VOC family protein [Ktedonobacterales bacterium]
MVQSLSVGAIHHVRMTVTDVERSRAFYTSVLGFQVAAEMPATTDDPVSVGLATALMGGVVLINGSTLFGLRPAGESHIASGDRFDEHRMGLDHISFSVPALSDLEAAARLLDERAVPHGEIRDLPAFGIYVLAFRDPDNIQLELTAPRS